MQAAHGSPESQRAEANLAIRHAYRKPSLSLRVHILSMTLSLSRAALDDRCQNPSQASKTSTRSAARRAAYGTTDSQPASVTTTSIRLAWDLMIRSARILAGDYHARVAWAAACIPLSTTRCLVVEGDRVGTTLRHLLVRGTTPWGLEVRHGIIGVVGLGFPVVGALVGLEVGRQILSVALAMGISSSPAAVGLA